MIYSFLGHCIQFRGNLVGSRRSLPCEKLYQVLFSRSESAGGVPGFSDWEHDLYRGYPWSNFFEMRLVMGLRAYFSKDSRSSFFIKASSFWVHFIIGAHFTQALYLDFQPPTSCHDLP